MEPNILMLTGKEKDRGVGIFERLYLSQRTIYGLIDPRDGKFHYVGQTKNLANRIGMHRNGGHSKALRQWKTDLDAAGVEMEFEILETAPDVWAATETEKKWILNLLLEGHPLTNYEAKKRQPATVAAAMAIIKELEADRVEIESILNDAGVEHDGHVTQAERVRKLVKQVQSMLSP